MTRRVAAPQFSRPVYTSDTAQVDVGEAVGEVVRTQLEQRGHERAVLARRRMPLLEFAQATPEARGSLLFERFTWQPGILAALEGDREVVVEKSVQVGLSTIMVRAALWHPAIRQHKALYTFPTLDEVQDFSRDRIAAVIRGSPLLRSLLTADAINNVRLRQIGLGLLYMRGANRPIDSIDADVVFFDEYNTSDQRHIEATERRVTGPMSAGLLRRLGVPTFPNFGVTAAFERSDRRIWQVKCAACGKWNPFHGIDAWRHNVDLETATVVCRSRSCRRPLDVRAGEWVAQHPDRDVIGFHVPKLIVHGAPLRKLVENSRKTSPEAREEFMRKDLAVAWAPEEGRLSVEQLRACVRRDLVLVPSLSTDRYPVTMGIDVASARAFNVTIEEGLGGDVGRKVWIGEVSGTANEIFQQLVAKMELYGVHMACIDHAPDGLFAREFAARFPGRVYRVGFYTPKPGQSDPATWTVDDAEAYIGLWRSVAIAATLQRFRLQRVLLPDLDVLPAGTRHDDSYVAQLGNMVRRVVETTSGNKKVEWEELGPVDYLQAEVYNLAAIEVFWRNSGLERAAGGAARPLAHGEVYVGGELSDLDAPPVYRDGFDLV